MFKRGTQPLLGVLQMPRRSPSNRVSLIRAATAGRLENTHELFQSDETDQELAKEESSRPSRSASRSQHDRPPQCTVAIQASSAYDGRCPLRLRQEFMRDHGSGDKLEVSGFEIRPSRSAASTLSPKPIDSIAAKAVQTSYSGAAGNQMKRLSAARRQ